MHPQGCQILSLDPLLFGFNHMPVNWCIRQDSHLQTLRSKRRMIIISPRMRKWLADGETRTLGAMRPAVYETAAVAAEPHRRNGGSPRCCPMLCGLRDHCIAAMLATQRKRDAKAELNRRNQACEVLTDTGSRREKWTSIRVARPVFRFGRPACISQHLCSEKWNPVLESHQPLRFCKPPPELLGQRDRN